MKKLNFMEIQEMSSPDLVPFVLRKIFRNKDSSLTFDDMIFPLATVKRALIHAGLC